MSFFGFDTTLPPDRGGRKHPQQAPGFRQTEDAFAGLSLKSGKPGPDDDDDDDGFVLSILCTNCC